MGCSQTKPKSLQQRIIEQELKLHFSKVNVLKVRQAFTSFLDDDRTVVNFRQFRLILSSLDIQYSSEEERMVKKFLYSFFAYEDEEVAYYKLRQLLISMYLLSNDTQENKASALYDLYDEDFGLSEGKIAQVIQEIIEVVQSYTKNLLEVNNTMIILQESSSKRKIEELIPQVIKWFCSENDNLTKENFLAEVKRTSTSRGRIDFTDPTSIRNAFLNFIIQTKETHIELQSLESKSDPTTLASSRISSLNSLKDQDSKENLTLDLKNIEG